MEKAEASKAYNFRRTTVNDDESHAKNVDYIC
jgi:hypothetical protein